MTAASYTTQCCICRKTVDMREPENGGDEHGAELYGGIWVCSGDCWDKAQEALPQMTGAEIAAISRDPAAALAEIASWRAAFRGQTFSVSELGTMRAERDAERRTRLDYALRCDILSNELEHVKAERDRALAEAVSWHTAMRGHEAACMAELDKMRAKCDHARKSSIDHALRCDALAKVIDRADADRSRLAAQVTVLRDALLAMRPGDDAGRDVAYDARWLRRKIDAALAASAQRKGNE